ncbi:MAG: hypothetical protein M5U28_29045 [Sandaracinaceae bacterium]|nr:hypothetical protein [Sandaracinaceae bacterium]
MRRVTHGSRDGYRSAAPPSPPRFTVITVRPDEYAQPAWLRELRETWRRLLGRGKAAR